MAAPVSKTCIVYDASKSHPSGVTLKEPRKNPKIIGEDCVISATVLGNKFVKNR